MYSTKSHIKCIELELTSVKNRTFYDENVNGVCLDNLRGICQLNDGINLYFGDQNGYGKSLLQECSNNSERYGESSQALRRSPLMISRIHQHVSTGMLVGIIHHHPYTRRLE